MTALPALWESLYEAPPADLRSLPTARLVDRARGRDAEAERALYDRHARAIHRFALDFLGNHSDAGDAVQETFARAFRMLATLGDADQYVAWLYGIARNVCLECLKSRRRWRRLCDEVEQVRPEPDRASNPEADLVRRELARRLAGALDELSTHRKHALLMRCDGLAYHEIARSMGWSLAKAKVEVHRARRELRALLELAPADRRARRWMSTLLGLVTIATLWTFLLGAHPSPMREASPSTGAVSSVGHDAGARTNDDVCIVTPATPDAESMSTAPISASLPDAALSNEPELCSTTAPIACEPL